MSPENIVVLGIPFDNVSFTETITVIFDMIDRFQEDRRPRLVATANVDFIVKTLSWRFNRSRHPELLDILRRADLVVADGMPVVWASRWLGAPLKERVAGSDLLPALAAATERRPLSCYFLGGREGVGARAAALLQEKYPDFHVVGVDAPFIQVAGEGLHDALESDAAIVERINCARPDILFVALGNPKQEIWFNRNRFRLQVPVTIGIGGTFEFVAGTVKRAPVWIQRLGLEWLHRIFQDPWRLWKRYLVDAYSFGLLLLPPLLHYRWSRWRQNWRCQPQERDLQINPGGGDAGELLRVVALPPRLDGVAVSRLQEMWQELQKAPQDIVLDFAGVEFIDSSGLGQLIKGWRQAQVQQQGFFLMRVGQRVQRFLSLNRLWDIMQPLTFADLEEILTELKQRRSLPAFSFTMEQRSRYLLLRLYGRLDAAAMATLAVPDLLARLAGRHVIVNLSNLDFVDSSGIALLLKIHRQAAGQGKSCTLCGLNPTVQQVLVVTRLHRFFTITPDLESSEQSLKAEPCASFSCPSIITTVS